MTSCLRIVGHFQSPPASSTVRVLQAVEGVTLTNQPDPDRFASDRNSGNPGPVGSCLLRVFKGIVVLLLVFGVVLVTSTLIGTVFFDRPITVNGRPAGKLEAVFALAGFLAMWVSISALLLFVAGKISPGPEAVLAAGSGGRPLGVASGLLRVGRRPGLPSRDRTAGGRSPGESGRGDDRGRLPDGHRADVAIRIGLGRTGALRPAGADRRRGPDRGFHDLSARAHCPSGGSAGLDPEVPPLAERPPLCAALGCLAATMFWNGLTGIFVWLQLGGMDGRWAGWKGWLFLTPFILIGVVVLAFLVMNLFQAINDTRAGRAVVEVSMNPLEPGRRCKVFISGQSALAAMVVRLVCVEEVKYGTGTENDPYSTESKRVRTLELHRGDGLPSVPGLPFETTFTFEVPADAMHSLEVENNKITWLLEVEAGPGDPPRVHREFPIVVNPPVRPEACHD